MARRSQSPSAFRTDRSTGPAAAPSRRQAFALLAGLLVVACGVTVASYLVKPNKARAFELFYGSLLINDDRSPVFVDLTNGGPTVRLRGAHHLVGAAGPGQMQIVPLDGGTLLLDPATGAFNLLDSGGLVVKPEGGGVTLPRLKGSTRAMGIAAGENAYLVQSGPDGTSVYLVGQATVQAAAGAGAKAKPRASLTTPEPTLAAPASAAAADGDLWLLAGTGEDKVIRRLTVPRGSDAGAPLASDEAGTVSGVAAVGAAGRSSDGSGGSVVAVASHDRVELFSGGARIGSLAIDPQRDVDAIVPATGQDGRISFLYHSPGGWRLLTVRTDGSAATGPSPLAGIEATAALAPPVAGSGRLYTIDRTTGRLWQLALDGRAQPVPGAGSYPTAKGSNGADVERAAFDDASVIARGSRVVFNSPHHVNALAVFTDGSHAPVRIDKNAATDMSAAGTAAALTRDPVPGAKPNRKPQQPRPQEATPAQPPVAPINNKIDCKTTVQVPHIPTITQAIPGSRSVQLLWNYPLLDTQDCAPSTYTVQVKALSADAPAVPASLTVQGQNGVTIAKLYPGTRYQITVTAYLNGQGTPSQPITVTTGPEGPAAPTNLRTLVDDAGNWTVSWNSCGGIAEGCVPAASWSLLPEFCDGSGLSSPPATVSVAGDPTQHTFTAVYRGNDLLLGRGLSFRVQGIGTRGTIGAPASDRACSYSWTRPNAQAITLHASQPEQTSLGGTASTTVALDLGSNPVRNQGGVGAQFTYQLLTGGGTVAQTLGPTSRTSVTFDGIAAGTQYQARAIVSPPRHPIAADSVTVGPVPISTRAAWPQLSVAATFSADPGQFIDLFGTLTVRISGISSAAAGGEQFDLADSSFRCSSVGQSLEKSSFDPASESIVVRNVALLLYSGRCSVTVALVESAGTVHNPPVFGGTTSAMVTTDVRLGDAPALGARAGDFAAEWDANPDPNGRSDVIVKYTGKASQSELDQLATDWNIRVVAPNNGDVCAVGTATPTPSGIAVPVDQKCLQRGGIDPDGGQWTVQITYHNRAGGDAVGPHERQVTGRPPTYQATPAPTTTPTVTPTVTPTTTPTATP